MNSSGQHRYGYLDSTRGIAALIVLLAHFQLTILPSLNGSLLLKSPAGILTDGKAAILYFFILSGFVLTLSLRNSAITLQNTWRFIFARIFRIYPAFITTLVVTALLLQNISVRPASWLDQYWTEYTSLLSILKQSVLIVRSPYDPLQRLIPHDWTLTIEISLSLILPVLAAFSRTHLPFMLLFVYLSIKFLALDPFVFDFALGVYMASNREMLVGWWQKSRLKMIFVIAGIFLIVADYIIPESMNRINIILIHHKSWGLAILLTAILSSQRIQQLLSIKPLVFLGRISYSFYLLHLILLLWMTVFLQELNSLIFFITYISLTTLIATISYYIIERPSIYLGKSILLKAGRFSN